MAERQKSGKTASFPAVFDDSKNDKDTYTVTFPDIPGAVSEGKGIEQARANAREALKLMLDGMKELPESSDIDGIGKKYPNAVVETVTIKLN